MLSLGNPQIDGSIHNLWLSFSVSYARWREKCQPFRSSVWPDLNPFMWALINVQYILHNIFFINSLKNEIKIILKHFQEKFTLDCLFRICNINPNLNECQTKQSKPKSTLWSKQTWPPVCVSVLFVFTCFSRFESSKSAFST